MKARILQEEPNRAGCKTLHFTSAPKSVQSCGCGFVDASYVRSTRFCKSTIPLLRTLIHGASDGRLSCFCQAWFNGFNWEDCANFMMTAPHIPTVKGKKDLSC